MKLRLLGSFILVSLFLVSLASASSLFGYDLSCYQGCDNGQVNIEDQVILKLELKNDFSYWVLLGESQYSGNPKISITSENSNLEKNSNTFSYELSSSTIYLPPKSSLEFYIPLETYNNLKEDKRIGDWVIKSVFTPSSANYYENPFNGKEVSIKSAYKIPSTIVASQLKFEGIGDEVTINKNPLSSTGNVISGWFKNWGGYSVAGVLILVIGSLIVYFFTRR